jgi:hypothetical protein
MTGALLLAAVALAALPTAVAIADDRPALVPTRDVDVTYRSQPGDVPVEQRSRFSAAAQRTRLDLPTPGLFSIMDYRNSVLSLVSVGDRQVLETKRAAAAPGAYMRRGEDVVAGLPCTEWEMRDSVGQPAITCVTPDGVMLRARRGAQLLAVATSVVYAPQQAALFEVPPGFERVQRRPQQ